MGELLPKIGRGSIRRRPQCGGCPAQDGGHPLGQTDLGRQRRDCRVDQQRQASPGRLKALCAETRILARSCSKPSTNSRSPEPDTKLRARISPAALLEEFQRPEADDALVFVYRSFQAGPDWRDRVADRALVDPRDQFDNDGFGRQYALL